MIRSLVRDVVGSAPYEKRLVELLKNGRDKRALKLAKRKVRLKTFLGFFTWCRNADSRTYTFTHESFAVKLHHNKCRE